MIGNFLFKIVIIIFIQKIHLCFIDLCTTKSNLELEIEKLYITKQKWESGGGNLQV